MPYRMKRVKDGGEEVIEETPQPLDRESALKMVTVGLDALTDPANLRVEDDGIVRAMPYAKK